MPYNFLAWIIQGDDGSSDITEENILVDSPDVHRQILSIGQDLQHCSTRGSTKTPKHVALPVQRVTTLVAQNL